MAVPVCGDVDKLGDVAGATAKPRRHAATAHLLGAWLRHSPRRRTGVGQTARGPGRGGGSISVGVVFDAHPVTVYGLAVA